MVSVLLRLLLWFAACSPSLAVIAQRGLYDYGRHETLHLGKRDLGLSRVVTGAPRINGSLGIRHEIRRLEADEDLWNLFILGLNWMQYMNQSDTFSWYQIAGSWVRSQSWHDFTLTASRYPWRARAYLGRRCCNSRQ